MKNNPNKKWSTVIIDDETSAREVLRSLLDDYCPDINIIGEAKHKEEAVNMILRLQPDIIFMDIDLGEGTAFEVLDQIKLKNVKVIFTTGYDEFAAKAFRYAAIDYLLKPIDPALLIEAVSRVTEQYPLLNSNERFSHLQELLQEKVLAKITLINQQGYTVVLLDDIVHIQSDGNYCTVYLKDGRSVMITRLISDFEKTLPDSIFFRTHQRYIVNLNFVEMVLREDGGTLLLKDGERLPIARRRKEELLNKLGINKL